MIAIQQDLDLRLHLSNSGKEPKLPWAKQAHVDYIKFIQYLDPDNICPRILNVRVDMQDKYRICLYMPHILSMADLPAL